jgi:cation transport ATPase
MILQRATLPLDTLGCAAASVPVEHALRSVPGVTHVYVNPVTEMAYIEYDSDRCDERTLRAALDQLGYGAAPADPPRTIPRHRQRGFIGRLLTVASRALRRRRSTATRNLQNLEKTQ